jgi:hypothetical protein
LKLLSPEEGWQHFKLWGRLFGIFKAARKRAIKEDRLFRSWNPEDWLSFMFNSS